MAKDVPPTPVTEASLRRALTMWIETARARQEQFLERGLELDRLREVLRQADEEKVRLREALHALVAVEPLGESDVVGRYCVMCDADEQEKFEGPFAHDPDCPWVVARALLKSGDG